MNFLDSSVRFPSEQYAMIGYGTVAYGELAIRFCACKYRKGVLDLDRDVRGGGFTPDPWREGRGEALL